MAQQILTDREKRKMRPVPAQGRPVYGMTGAVLDPNRGIIH